VKIAELILVFW